MNEENTLPPEGEQPQAEAAAPARKRAPRKTTAKKAPLSPELTPADTSSEPAEVEAVAAAAPARKRAPRKTAAPKTAAAVEVAEATEAVSQPTTNPEADTQVTADASPSEMQPEDGPSEAEMDVTFGTAADAEHGPSNDAEDGTASAGFERRKRRQDYPNRGKQVPISDEPVPALGFEDIVAGALDAEMPADAPGFPKRVLPPQPELPKLHKVLAQAGLGSRLEMEKLIADGGVTVNNQPAHIGQRIQFGDKVRLKGKLLRLQIAPPMPRVLIYHKPAGEVVTHDDPQNRPTVFRRLPRLGQGKWQSVGRLDLNTEGLLLFTSSGELANRMMHPSFGLEREYAARVLGALDADEKRQLLAGIELEDGMAQFGSIHDGGGDGANVWYRVTIAEGRNREVRRMFESLGHAVSRLIRIRYGEVTLPQGLRRGFYMEMGSRDVQALMDAAGMDLAALQPKHRVDSKRAQAKAGGLRRAQGGSAPGFEAEAGEGGEFGERRESRVRRTAFGRKRPMSGQKGNAYGNGGEGQPRQDRQDRNFGGNKAGRSNKRGGQGDWQDDEFSQRGVSHESPFETKAARKKIFTSNNQVPDIIRAQRQAEKKGQGKGKGGIDPLRTRLDFLNRR